MLLRFVVLGEGAVHEVRRPELRHSLGEHDERVDRPGLRVGLRVRDVADPLVAVPLDARARRVPGLALGIGACAVVEDAAVGGPVPGPAFVAAEARGVARIAPRHHVALFGEAAAVDPVAACGGAVGFELGETRHLLPGR